MYTKRQSQNGTTLIEALVALLVLSIGLLGVAALQMNSMRANHGAYFRSQATALAYDIADRMRANRNDALAAAYNISTGTVPTGSTLPLTDLSIWKQTLASILPAGDGSVAVGNTGIARITILWTDRLGTDTFVTDTQI